MNRPFTEALNPASHKSSTCFIQVYGREHHVLRSLPFGAVPKQHSVPTTTKLKTPKEQAHRGHKLLAEQLIVEYIGH